MDKNRLVVDPMVIIDMENTAMREEEQVVVRSFSDVYFGATISTIFLFSKFEHILTISSRKARKNSKQ